MALFIAVSVFQIAENQNMEMGGDRLGEKQKIIKKKIKGRALVLRAFVEVWKPNNSDKYRVDWEMEASVLSLNSICSVCVVRLILAAYMSVA